MPATMKLLAAACSLLVITWLVGESLSEPADLADETDSPSVSVTAKSAPATVPTTHGSPDAVATQPPPDPANAGVVPVRSPVGPGATQTVVTIRVLDELGQRVGHADVLLLDRADQTAHAAEGRTSSSSGKSREGLVTAGPGNRAWRCRGALASGGTTLATGCVMHEMKTPVASSLIAILSLVVGFLGGILAASTPDGGGEREGSVAPAVARTALERHDPASPDIPLDGWLERIQVWADAGGLVEVLARDPAATNEFLLRIARSGEVDGWLERIQVWADRGGLVRALARDPEAASEFLFRIALQTGDAQLADRLLEEGVDLDSEDRVRVAQLHLSRGDTLRATELYLQVFAEDPNEDGVFEALVLLAPERALETLGDFAPSLDFPHWDDDEVYRFAVLLHHVGRSVEACPFLLELLDRRSLGDEGLIAVAQLAPEEAEVLLRENLITGGPCGNPYLAAREQLFDFLELRGESEEIVQQLFQELDEGPLWFVDDHHELLVRLAPERWVRQLRRAVREPEADGESWIRLGECQAALGDETLAVDSFLRAFDDEGLEDHEYDCDWLQRAVTLGPDRVLPAMRARVNEDDARDWDWYATACWITGRRNEAIQAWEQGRELEPQETWFFARLERAARGFDPLTEDDEERGAWWPGELVFD